VVTSSTVKQSARARGARADALTRRITQLRAKPDGDAELDGVAAGLVDALLAADTDALTSALDALRSTRKRLLGQDGQMLGSVTTLAAVVQWGIERTGSEPGSAAPAGTQAGRFLEALAGGAQIGSSELRAQLGTDDTQVSRTGRRLLGDGLVTRRKAGRQVFWALTPRGARELEAAPQPGSDESFWTEVLRRGFEGAAGDQPGELREVDPTRERIVQSTIALHDLQGIRATTWEEIAARAGVDIPTVESHFPTFDDLLTACGQHFVAGLQLPPPDRAAELFAGIEDEHAGVHRLVETVFDVYERRGVALVHARADRDLAVVGAGLGAVDRALDALTAAALAARTPTPETVAAVRALTDLVVWRALRDQGASPAQAVEQTTAIVEGWLATA
jgi:AcrR family transcriptional regulator/DNA-binding transcriptional ArsR family regulator